MYISQIQVHSHVTVCVCVCVCRVYRSVIILPLLPVIVSLPTSPSGKVLYILYTHTRTHLKFRHICIYTQVTTNLTSPLPLYTLLYYTVLTVMLCAKCGFAPSLDFLAQHTFCPQMRRCIHNAMVYVCTYTIDCDMFSPQMRGYTYMNIVCTQCSILCLCVCMYILLCPQMQGSRASSGARVWRCSLWALSMSPFQS